LGKGNGIFWESSFNRMGSEHSLNSAVESKDFITRRSAFFVIRLYRGRMTKKADICGALPRASLRSPWAILCRPYGALRWFVARRVFAGVKPTASRRSGGRVLSDLFGNERRWFAAVADRRYNWGMDVSRLSPAFQALYCDPAVFASCSDFIPINFARVLPFQAEEALLAGASDETLLKGVGDFLRKQLQEDVFGGLIEFCWLRAGF
jgi:hypothetical protein